MDSIWRWPAAGISWMSRRRLTERLHRKRSFGATPATVPSWPIPALAGKERTTRVASRIVPGESHFISSRRSRDVTRGFRILKKRDSKPRY
jgi:hypothetical protein